MSYRFYIDRESSCEWAKVLKEVAMSFKDQTSSVPPPVAARSGNAVPTAPRGPPPPLPADRYGPIQRAQSTGVAAGIHTY